MNCPYWGRERTTSRGVLVRECKLAKTKTGMRPHVPEVRCEKCAQKDDGTTFVSQLINFELKNRLSSRWRDIRSLSLEAAAGKLYGRLGEEELITTLAKAEVSGMPHNQVRSVGLAAGVDIDAR